LTKAAPLELVYSQEVKIKNLTDGAAILQLLNYLFVLLSVKKDNQPNELEESVLNGVIVSSFKNWTINEIKHAFRLAVDGTLNIDMYQKLDSITFGRVMKTYKEHKQLKIRNFKTTSMSKEDKIVTDSEKNAIEQTFVVECVNPYLEDRKTMTEPRINWATYSIFQYFWKKGDIKISKKDKKKYNEQAVKHWKAALKERRNQGERVNIEEVMSHRTHTLYASCLALYDKAEKLKDD